MRTLKEASVMASLRQSCACDAYLGLLWTRAYDLDLPIGYYMRYLNGGDLRSAIYTW